MPLFFEEKALTKRGKKTVAVRAPLQSSAIPPAHPYALMTDEELLNAPPELTFTMDVECYSNYFLIGFKCVETHKALCFELGFERTINFQKLLFVLYRFKIITFNGIPYDQYMLMACLAGLDPAVLKAVSNELIGEGVPGWIIQRREGWRYLNFNHIDLIEVAPLSASLKIYGGRLHCPRMQDLPFEHTAILTEAEAAIVRDYNINDLDITELLYIELLPHLALRERLGVKYRLDLRSKSDAQLAEAIIKAKLTAVLGHEPPKPQDRAGQVFYYQPPAYVRFQTPALQAALDEVCREPISVGMSGYAQSPGLSDEDGKGGKPVWINGRLYTIGLGGLHSKEKKQAIVSTDEIEAIDKDVTGYYPNLILKNSFSPEHLGNIFLNAFQGIVDDRTTAKRAVQEMERLGLVVKGTPEETEANGGKIASNGIFGKLSDPYSIVNDPIAMVQVTLTGQFSLLMLAEALELNGFSVVSANTDGIVTMVEKSRNDFFQAIVKSWETITALETEETKYKALYSRDVNNYIAIKEDSKTKEKGIYAERGSALNSVLSKNPETLILSDAVQAFLSKGIPLAHTIEGCRDIRRFVSIRSVTGGAEKDGVYLGKAIRWYYAKGEKGFIATAKTGNKVPKTDGAKPCMDLPRELPNDIDYDWYLNAATEMLYDLGYYRKPEQQRLI